jgi:DNA transformation protein
MTALSSMKNIGKELETKLKSIGIKSAEELVHAGSIDVFAKLKEQYSNVCLVHLYALEGAISDIDYNSIPEHTKQYLKSFSDSLK